MLCENLRRARKSRGLSQAELATELNVVRQTISKWEKGLSIPDYERLARLSEVLEVPIDILLGDGTIPEKQNGMDQLERLEREIEQEREHRQRQQHRFSIVLLLCGGAMLCWSGIPKLFLWSVRHKLAAAAAEETIIGGADAATSLYTVAPFNGIGTMILGGGLIVAALYILFQIKRKRGS